VSEPELVTEPLSVLSSVGGNTEDAPWGRRKDGTPRKRPGRKPQSGSNRAPRKNARRKAPERVDYGMPIRQLAQLAGTALLVRRQMDDALTVGLYAEPIADAVNELANEVPMVARVCEYLMTAGPYGALISSVAMLGFQIAANHKVIAPGQFGTLDHAQLVTTTIGTSDETAS